MKKNGLLFILFLGAFSFMALEPGGAAKKGLGDRTGSPVANGTCGSSGCHSGGSFSPVTTIQVLDASNQPVTNYHSDSTYTVKVGVTGTGSKQYAFQIIALNSSNANAGTFSNVPTNTQIVQVGTRFVVEQKAPFDVGSWSFNWKAPNSTSPVTFYACGLATNKNGKESGDQSSTTSLKLEKTTATQENQTGTATFSIKNISSVEMMTSGSNFNNGSHTLSILDINGIPVRSQKVFVDNESFNNTINIANLSSGIYFVTIDDKDKVQTLKFFKK